MWIRCVQRCMPIWWRRAGLCEPGWDPFGGLAGLVSGFLDFFEAGDGPGDLGLVIRRGVGDLAEEAQELGTTGWNVLEDGCCGTEIFNDGKSADFT